MHDNGAGADLSVASLLFEPGDRAGAEEVRALALSDPSFMISLDPQEGQAAAGSPASSPKKAGRGAAPDPPQQDRWLELLANGLTFDLQGLSPGLPQVLPPYAYAYGLPVGLSTAPLEAISLRPGPHIAAGGRMLPVVRGLAWLTAVLAALPQVRAVAWHAARTWSAPDHFRGSVLRWVEGGAFPGLGLTALAPTPEGGLQSEGLALFTGQELRLAPELAFDRASGARLALRLLHWLVENGKLEVPAELSGPSGEPLKLVPTENRRFVGVLRR